MTVRSRLHIRLSVVSAALTVLSAVLIPITLSANAAVAPPPSGWTHTSIVTWEPPNVPALWQRI